MWLLVENTLLLGNVSCIAAKISCVRSPRDVVHSCGHSGEVATGEACVVAGHHAWTLVRVSWCALIDLTWSGICNDIGTYVAAAPR